MQKHSNTINFYKELMSKIKDSDESAFAILYDQLWERMYALAFSLLKNKDTSKDLVQEVFVDFWIRRFEIGDDNIEAYLIKATRFKVYNELRNNKFNSSDIDTIDHAIAPQASGILENLNFNETKQRIDQAVEKLPKKRQQIFTLSRYNELNNFEISQKLGISKRTVETQISLAIRSIKSELNY